MPNFRKFFVTFMFIKVKKNSEHVQVRLIDVRLQHLFSLTDTRLSSYVRVGFIITLHSLNDTVKQMKLLNRSNHCRQETDNLRRK